VPNPRVADADGKERMIVPGFWRSSVGHGMSDRPVPEPGSILTSIFADPLIYRGIENWQDLSRRNFERYGIHTLSDLEHFPDPESQEYFKRWKTHKIEGHTLTKCRYWSSTTV
jgi:hypothetical protein